MQKYEIIDLKLKGWSNNRIKKTFNVSRDTIRKYWNEYQANLSHLLETDSSTAKSAIIEDIVSDPHYDSSTRKPRKYNAEIDALLDKILADEKEKTRTLGPSHKQALTKRQIFQLIVDAGHDIGESTIRNKINEKLNVHAEAFIKQEYPYGQRFEYDFGEVKLVINGANTIGYLAVLTSPGSKFRWAYLYHNSKMDVFLDSQARFFEMVHGCYKEGVYDNMRNVVSKFIGRNEKELNETLIKFAMYYGFSINVTNCFSGNEKGTVESAVKWIRNKVFAVRYRFDSFEQAADYLQERLVDINKDSSIEEEKKYLTFYRPKYEVADITLNNVNKYGLIQVDTNFYSVPDDLVGKNVLVKKYPNHIEVYFKSELVATHERMPGKKKTCIDIRHYLNTFLKKPGALRNSTALNSIPRLKDIFDKYYTDKPLRFIEYINAHPDMTIDELVDGLNPMIIKADKPNWVEAATKTQIQSVACLFIGGNGYVN